MLVGHFCSEIQGCQMNHVFVDPEAKLVTKVSYNKAVAKILSNH